jgi:superfamily II DNA or RNA helicase
MTPNIIDLYNNYIQNRYNDLILSNKEIDNYDLAKIFEYYSCIQLSKKYNQLFYEYNDIDSEFKENNKMSRTDTGIDACNLIDTIVQCKLRKDTLRWEECSTFFGSQNIFDSELKKTVIRWNNLIITRNSECKLSKNLSERHELFTDISYSRDELINYCDNLIKNPIKFTYIKDIKFELRDYQLESIDIINKSSNSIISLPTGCGKNIIIIFSIDINKKYLILVPRIILMEQIKAELINHRPELKSKIQTIGDNNNKYDDNKNITICVYNSVSVIEKYGEFFDKIYIDEAHHINNPEIYELTNENELIEDDTEDEIKNTSGYNNIIKSFTKYNNNVYLSATIDEVDGFIYYKKDIRDMIDNKYLCDYTINIPIFSNDPTNKNICKHLLQNYRNIIIYCDSQKQGKQINNLLNLLQNKSSEYIDCNTSRIKRNKILDKYKKGEIPFLVNVRILVEGFDSPITKGVCFIHLPSSRTTIIQIIGRALRLHNTKTFANIILPFLSKEDESNISKFLQILAQNDTRIKKSYESKKEGGYISIEKIYQDDNLEDVEFRYEMIYDSMGVLQNGEDIWSKKLEWVMRYIDENGKRPSKDSENIEIRSYGNWIAYQQKYYTIKTYIFENENIYKLWTEFINNDKYKKYFLSDEESWMNILENIKKIIDDNYNKPTSFYKKINGYWLSLQNKIYIKKEGLMKNDNIYNIWNKFINDNKYKKYILSNEEEWVNKLEIIKKYMDENKCRPSSEDENNEISSYGKWLQHQKTNYDKKIHIMKNDDIREKWTLFINNSKYKKYFLSNEDLWNNSLEIIKKYIDDNKKRPSANDKNKEIKSYSSWVSKQVLNYIRNKHIMLNIEIRKKWELFINDPKYKEYFISSEDYWINILENIKKYIIENNKRPSSEDKDETIKFYGKWLGTQKITYIKKENIMKNEEIRKLWELFIKDPNYLKYFK